MSTFRNYFPKPFGVLDEREETKQDLGRMGSTKGAGAATTWDEPIPTWDDPVQAWGEDAPEAEPPVDEYQVDQQEEEIPVAPTEPSWSTSSYPQSEPQEAEGAVRIQKCVALYTYTVRIKTTFLSHYDKFRAFFPL